MASLTIYSCVFAIGRPIKMRPSSVVTRDTVEYTVVSVGPYRFQSSPHRSNKGRIRSRGSGSPAVANLMPGWLSKSASRIIRHIAGVACIKLTLYCDIAATNATESFAVARSTTATDPPTINGRNISMTLMSNESVVVAMIRSSAVKPGHSAMETRKLTAALC